jgi:DNA-binding winged helix-turn-helix (wHTH) protein
VPTVLRLGPRRYYFYSHEPNEPPHVHVDQGDLSAKVWLEQVTLARNLGFRAHALNDILREVRDHRTQFLEAWRGYFGDGR